MKRLILLAAAGTVAGVMSLHAGEEPLSTVEVFAARETIRPGDELPVAVRIHVADGWHTYAENPGDSGMPPSIEISGPDGRLETGPWRFPPHQTFTGPTGTTYGYENQVVLFGRVSVPAAYEQGRISLDVSIKWMICRDVCRFLKAEKTLPVNLGPEASAETESWHALTRSPQ